MKIVEDQKQYYGYADILRIILCLGVLFYHLGHLKGGYLAVCGFFVLTGFFTCRSLDREDFSLIGYYKGRFLRLYIPLLCVVFCVIIAWYAYDFAWVSLKPETTSVLAGYNNYFRIMNGTDYFARAEETPFTHLWYISIVLQFEIVFPLVYVLLKKASKRIKADWTSISVITLAAAIIYSYISFYENGIVLGYYGSLERLYSLLFGITAYLMVKDAKPSKSWLNQSVFWIMTTLIIASMLCFDGSSEKMPELMILFSLAASLALGASFKIETGDNIVFKGIKYIAGMTYEIYLVHFPVIYILLTEYFYGEMEGINILYTVLLIFGISLLLHILLGKGRKTNLFIFLLCMMLGFTSAFGMGIYLTEPDHTVEMAQLKAELEEEETRLSEKQKEYIAKLSEEKEKWDVLLSEYADEDFADRAADQIRVCGIGDSAMLGASPWLYSVFPNFYCDAVVSRPGLYVRDIMASLKAYGILDKAVVVHIGANGGLWDQQLSEITAFANDNDLEIFWVTVTNDKSPSVYCNDGIRYVCSVNENAHLIDWEILSAGHGSWFVSDGIHVTAEGATAYASYIYDAVHSVFREKFEKERQVVLNEYDALENEKYSFYGSDLLLSINDAVSGSFEDARFNIFEESSADAFLKALREDLSNDLLARNVVLFFDKGFECSREEFENIRGIIGDRHITIVFADDNEAFDAGDVGEIDLSEIFENKEYVYADKIHLNEKGIELASKMVLSGIKK